MIEWVYYYSSSSRHLRRRIAGGKPAKLFTLLVSDDRPSSYFEEINTNGSHLLVFRWIHDGPVFVYVPLAIVNRTKFAKTELFYGIGESYESFASLKFPSVEKYTSTFLDENQDLVQDTVFRGGGGEGSSDYFTHKGRTYLREGMLNSKPVYFYLHRTKVFKDVSGGGEEYRNTAENFCYFEK